MSYNVYTQQPGYGQQAQYGANPGQVSLNVGGGGGSGAPPPPPGTGNKEFSLVTTPVNGSSGIFGFQLLLG